MFAMSGISEIADNLLIPVRGVVPCPVCESVCPSLATAPQATGASFEPSYGAYTIDGHLVKFPSDRVSYDSVAARVRWRFGRLHQ
jgi:hypothetical protein